VHDSITQTARAATAQEAGMAAKKRRPRVSATEMFFFLAGQIAAVTTALRAVCLGVPERRAEIEEVFDADSVDTLEEIAEMFPRAMSEGYEIWADQFSEFLEAGAYAEDEADDEPPEPANDSKH
jgi:hypothetical protein